MLTKTEIEKLSTKELINLIIKEYHIPLRKLLKQLNNVIEDLKEKYDMDNISEVYKQFEFELISHIDREEIRFFSEIIDFDAGISFNKERIKEFLKFQNIEHYELKNYLVLGEDLVVKFLNKNNGDKKVAEFKKFIDLLNLVIKNIVYIEDNILNPRIEKKLKKV